MPGLKIQKKILEVQNKKCLYCEKQFGDLYMKNGKVRQLKIQWDHLIPYSYSKENKFNFVAACNICNQIKSNKIFNTVEEVFHYVRYHREKKGIQYI
jgi:5-methylcytosine-specific restriction endonuclease McrA